MRKTAVEALQNRRFPEAIALLSELIRRHPKDAESHRLLGIAFVEQGEFASAEGAFSVALEIAPQNSDYWRDYALCLHRNQRLHPAEAAIRRALSLQPNKTGFYSDLGRILFASGDLKAAAAELQKGLQLDANNGRLHFELGVILHELKSLSSAAKHLNAALRVNPKHPDAWSHLGGVYFKLAMLKQAEEAFRMELQLQPGSISALAHLGNVFLKQGSNDRALNCYRKALALDQQRAESWFNLGNALSRLYQLSAAEEAFQNCLSLESQHPNAAIELAGVHLSQGQSRNALELLQQACREVKTATADSNYFYALHMHDPPDPKAELAAMRGYESKHGLPTVERSHRAKGDRYRIAFLSPDFRKHSVSYFVEPLLEHYDQSQFEISCFYVGWEVDRVTERLRGHVDRWFDAVSWSDAEIAKAISEQGIDCLIDLAGHTGNNRLPVFTARPAPVQVTFLGYSGSTGLDSIDYLLTDALANPPDSQPYCSERLLYLPSTYFCYRPPHPTPDVAPLPYEQLHRITFGCFNNRAKLSRRLLKAWAEILRRVPDSRLLLKNMSLLDKRTANSITSFFEAEDIHRERILLRQPQRDLGEHLATYHEVDIGLDSFPYNGATTTCEALWMGVPVISWTGPTHVSRMGLSLLSSVGLPQLVASSMQQYVDKAVSQASAIDELRELRFGMRKRLQHSPLMDEIGYARNFEAVLKKILK